MERNQEKGMVGKLSLSSLFLSLILAFCFVPLSPSPSPPSLIFTVCMLSVPLCSLRSPCPPLARVVSRFCSLSSLSLHGVTHTF